MRAVVDQKQYTVKICKSYNWLQKGKPQNPENSENRGGVHVLKKEIE